MTEAELAAGIVAWLQDRDWQVYQEVRPGYSGPRADIVATHGPVIWVVETKTSLSMELVGQALRWKPYANKVSIGIPMPRRQRPPGTQLVMRTVGLGEIHVGQESYGYRAIREPVVPVWGRVRRDKLRKALREEHKIMAKAGTKEGYCTPFRLTLRDLADHVEANPGVALRDAMDHIDHHYMSDKSARQCISQYLREGIIKEIRFEKVGKSIRLYPVDLENKGDEHGHT